MSADSFSQFAAYRNGVPFDRIRRYPVATATAAIAASLLAPVVSPTAVDGLGTASADCPDIEVVFGRGTTEGSGLGRFVESLRSKVGGRSVGAYAVDYAASYDFLAASGANDASAHIQHMIGAGPTTRLVLGGYSQGAAVMDVIAAVPISGHRVRQPATAEHPPLRRGNRRVRQPISQAWPAADHQPGVGRTDDRSLQRRRPGLPDRRREHSGAQRIHGRTDHRGGKSHRRLAVNGNRADLGGRQCIRLASSS
jgi:hypothetical protein